MFGEFIHDLTGPAIPAVIPGVRAVHAVDAAGVHPLLLAVGSERYVPYQERRRPQELLTQANAILGQGQLSLAKYLMIVADEDAPDLDLHDVPAFLAHLLARIDWTRDLHFQTRTTIDTLDYTGTGLNQGSKLVIAAAGEPVRELPNEIPSGLTLPDGFSNPRMAQPGILLIQGPNYEAEQGTAQSRHFCEFFNRDAVINQFPLIVIVDDSDFSAHTLNNFIWSTFTRSNPAADIDGIDAFTENKHWGCHGSLVIDARRKPHHEEPLIEDSKISAQVDELAKPGGPLHDLI
jgi:4-hydroxy-3-polyprenylbenzoate decarboxylase